MVALSDEEREQLKSEIKGETPPREPEQKLEKITINEALSRFEVGKEYADNLGNEKWLYENLIIARHILTIISMSGGGKTTFMFDWVARRLVKNGLIVWYIDADSPPSDHKRMKQVADEAGFRFLNPDVNQGTNSKMIVKYLQQLADNQTDLSDNVFFFDTLKKFTDLMSKGSVKDFFVLERKLTALGATTINLGHANKFRDKEGNLIFEGVGDVRADGDELIFFEKTPAENEGHDITTVVDTMRGAKVRGIFRPFSFNISPDRTITLLDKAIDIDGSAKTKVSDFDIVEAAREYLTGIDEPVPQKPFIEFVSDASGAGQKRVREIINKNSARKDTDGTGWKIFSYTVGDKNSHFYELTGNR